MGSENARRRSNVEYLSVDGGNDIVAVSDTLTYKQVCFLKLKLLKHFSLKVRATFLLIFTMAQSPIRKKPTTKGEHRIFSWGGGARFPEEKMSREARKNFGVCPPPKKIARVP